MLKLIRGHEIKVFATMFGVLLAAIFVGLVLFVNDAQAQNVGGAPLAQQENSRILIGVSREQVRDTIIARCLRSGAWRIDPERTTENTITCTQPADATQRFWRTPMNGQGRPPEWIFQFSYVDLGPAPQTDPGAPSETQRRLLVTGEMYMQSYSWTGQPAERIYNRAETQQARTVVNELTVLCTEPCGAGS